jgi:ribosomal protein L37E
MAKRTTSATIICPRCGVPSAKVIGRSESYPVIYLRCDDCGKTSVSPGD